ncbi:transporter substrate-binding domain-containing protein [Shewanella profunda]|nr:ABC transporter substrate-binding protein [Shewanella profunda]MCL1091777.1 transporter substrate-binding domain-containing protein [Shewanella profunda]
MVRSCLVMLGGLFSFLIAALTTNVKADTLTLTSLFWPPYSGQQLVEQGVSIAVARAAFNAMGHQLEVDFYPWSRAVKLASMPNDKYLGYLPEYYYETDKFVFSKPIGTSPLGLVEQKLHPISWRYIEDLNRYTLGVVNDYVNTESFDAMVLAGVQPIEAVTSDEHNIKKVVAGRIDAAVIDVNALDYLLKQKDLQPLTDKLQINRQLIANKQLYVAFRNTEEGRRWRDIFDQGLDKIDVNTIMGDTLYRNE